MNVLIVDDNEAAADLLLELLSLQDHTARCTYSAQQALQAVAEEPFDVALLDLTLPDLPGSEVARRLRKLPKPPLLIAVTGFSARDATGAEPGLFDHHLQKPIDFDALDRILAEASAKLSSPPLMKASPGARSWIAAGVRHEVLTRALPALRHDMSAPVSVMRMGLLMLKRQVAAPTVDAAACQERVALIDSQIGELVSAVRSLRDWELSTNDDGILRSALVTQCVALMRPAFDLQGVRLEIGAGLAADAAGPDEVRWESGAALRYLTLGALAFLLDSTPNLAAIQIDADGDAALRLSAIAGESEQADDMAGAHRAPRKLAIDAVALQSLADDLGYTLALERDAVRLPLVAG